VVAFVAIVATCSAAPASSQWQPNRNIEIIAPAAAGSALDSVSRLLQRLLQEKRLTSASMSVVNKTGGGNAVGFTYLASHAGDVHYVAVTPLTIITITSWVRMRSTIMHRGCRGLCSVAFWSRCRRTAT
jgi:putative tricarboxylic transport membrane protein